MNKLRLFLIALCALPLLSKAVETDPAGFVTVDLAGNSDSYVYIPFKRSAEFVGTAASLSANGTYDAGEPFTDGNSNQIWDNGETFTDTSNVIALTGTPGLTVNQFVYVSGTQPKRYYVFLKSGTRVGMYYSVVSNAATSLTVDTAGDDLTTAINSTTALEVIPYDTLGSIFPAGAGVNPSSSHSIAVRQTEILIPNNTSAGIDLASPVSYYYFSGVTGAGPGWRKAGVSAVLANDDVLMPDTFFVVRHNIATATSLTFTGTVQMSQLATPLGTIANSVDQDNAVALPFATELTLSQLKLFESGAFAGSSSHSIALRQDQVLVWDNSVLGKNKASGTSYYYFTGASGLGPGWRKSGVTGTIANDDVVIGPNKGIVIRKKSTGAPVTAMWSVKPPYVP
ncbi:TIGR02597 family protein [Prosthecobacter sp.]|uniref:TIGR02597 family protein n=1 Tax=Prosthecobacter sp. TaxID=1965333 RepID=UPI002ABCE3B1|nr:TIGR02597 family protein [Prosthecobacter sp.]MDZ4404484.1 TIGR02597 family protein [Prosthecobacter sp.]